MDLWSGGRLIRGLALVVSLCAGAFAQAPQLPSQIPVQYRDFSGGYVDNVDPANLKPSESPSLLNVVVDDPVGSLKPRKGIVRCGNLPSGNVPTALYEYSRSDGTRRLIASDNSTVYSTPDCQTWTTVTTAGLSSSAQVYFATVRDKLWIVNGSTWPQTYDGTTVNLLDGRTSTPNPPPGKCSFIEFWKERVWCGAPNGDPSGLQFSSLTDTVGNDVDPSTGSLSWPAINVFEIDQNAGSRLYGLKAYRNRLYAFKDNGIWEVGFDNDFQNFVRKTYASVGSRFQTSIVEVDGVLYFTGRDGIYAFDGETSVRISEKIKNKFQALNQPLISQNYKLWTTPADFLDATLVRISTYIVPGSIVLSTASATPTNGDFETGDSTNWTLAATNTPDWTTYCTGFISSVGGGNQCTDNSLWGPNDVSVVSYSGIQGSHALQFVQSAAYAADPDGDGIRCVTVGGAQASNPIPTVPQYTITDGNGSVLLTGAVASPTTTLDLTALATNYIKVNFSRSDNATYGGSGSESAVMQAGFTRLNTLIIRDDIVRTCSNRVDYIDWIQSTGASTGSWTSAVYNTVSVSTWGAFTATDASGGGGILYEIRYGTNTGAVQSMAFGAITSGSLIPANTSQTYIQVRATLTSADSIVRPQVDSVQIAWNNGGNNTQKIHSYGWKNSLWVSASSGTASTNNTVLRRAPAPMDSWTLYDLRLGPMATFNDAFYGGASTHSAIYRLDYGTNDDGAPITWAWESRDENFGLPNNAKYLPEIDADYRNNAACNIRLGYVQDQNTTYCVGTLPSPNAILATGTGSRRLNTSGGPAYSYRFKVCDDQKDQAPTIIGIQAIARPIPRRGD